MALFSGVTTVFSFFRGLWEFLPLEVTGLVFFVVFIFIAFSILRMTH